MMAQIRAFAKSPVANVLLGLLLISFVGWGVRGVVTSAGVRDQVVKAGSRPPISAQMFKAAFNRFKAQIEQEQNGGQPISMDEALKAGLDRDVVDEMAAAEAFADLINRAGVKPSDELVVQALRKFPSLFNPITGQFDKAAYARLLQQNDMTAAEAEGEIKDQIAQRQFASGIAAGLEAPLAYTALQAAYAQEARTFEWFAVSPQILGTPVKPTDAQLNAFLKENARQWTKPELRVLSVVHVSAAALAPSIPAPDADVQKRFNFEKDTLSSPEKRVFLQFPVKDAKIGAEIAAKLKGGGDPQALAKAYGVQAVPFIDQPKSAIPDKAVADAAFALQPGETSGVIQGALGPSVVKVFKVTPAHTATLDEAKPKIEAEVKAAAAQQKAYDLVQKYEDAHGGGADMAGAAKAAGQSVITTPPLAARGIDIQGQSANLPPKVLQTAFSLPQGGETDPINVGQGDYYIVHVDKVQPPALATLDEVRPKVTQFFVLRDAATKLQAKAQALQAGIEKGESFQDAAKSVGATVQTGKDVLRNGGGQGRPYSSDLVSRIFIARKGEVVVGEDVKLGYAVAKLDAVTAPSPAAIAPLALAQRPQISKSLFDDMGQAVRVAARTLVKPHIDYKSARKALGVDTSQTAPAQ
jgi:peptidyl-prolyl cis-trans isomerase D